MLRHILSAALRGKVSSALLKMDLFTHCRRGSPEQIKAYLPSIFEKSYLPLPPPLSIRRPKQPLQPKPIPLLVSYTPTPTQSRTPTSTPTRTPTRTPTPPTACSNAIQNGGFETTSAWELPATEYTAGYSTARVRSGSWAMRTGIVNSADNRYSYSSARQLVTIPYNAYHADLKLYLYPISGKSPFKSGF